MDEKINFLYDEEENIFRNCAKQVEIIYQKMQDDMSRNIFLNRIMFSLTGNAKFMRQVVLATKIGQSLYIKLKQSNQNIYIYGAGRRGQRLAEMFPELNWIGFIDQNKSEKYCNDLPIFSWSELKKDKKTLIVVSVFNDYKKIVHDLLDFGFDKKNIISLCEFDESIEDEVYFDISCIDSYIDKEKCFIDAGAFDGKNTISYMNKYFGNNCDKASVHVFEPDYENYLNCVKILSEYSGIKMWNLGLSDKAERVFFNQSGDKGGNINVFGNENIKVVALDEIMKDSKVGFIKMDIEGSEEKALEGSKNIIQKQSPILAISVYHKRSDIWKIPKLIIETNPNYEFYMRHYTVSYGDTVLYAICKNR